MDEGDGRGAGSAAWKRVSKFNLTECQGINPTASSFFFHSPLLLPRLHPPASKRAPMLIDASIVGTFTVTSSIPSVANPVAFFS